jgi:hypothetical protein
MRKLHDQDLVGILVELDDCRTPRAEVLKEQITRGDFYPLHKTYIPGHTEPMRSSAGRTLAGTILVYPRDQWECPLLTDEILPWPFLPTASEIQNNIRENIKTQSWQLAPSTGAVDTDHQAAVELLNSISQANSLQDDVALNWLVKPDMAQGLQPSSDTHHGMGSIVHLSSPELHALRNGRPLVDGEKGTLEECAVRMTVMPTEGVREMQHCDHYVVSTLITGVQLWVVFPCNDNGSNAETLRQVYEGIASGAEDAHGRWEDAAKYMWRGLVFVQRPGETLILPPLWPHLIFSVKTSVSATYYVAKAVYFPKRLKHLGLWQAASRCWNDTVQQQAHLVKYACNLLEHLGLIINNGVKGIEERTIKQIYTDWDGLRTSVYELVNSIKDPEIVRKLSEGFCDVWATFLNKRARKARRGVCRICGAPIDTLPDTPPNEFDEPPHVTALYKRVALHFTSAHWPRKEPEGTLLVRGETGETRTQSATTPGLEPF